VLLSCVDNPAARLAATITAALYLKPLLDLGTGILREDSAIWGADVRLVGPGRCLLCLGGIADITRGRAERFEGRPRQPADWRTQRGRQPALTQRSGCLPGAPVAGEWLIGRRQNSIWMHLEGTDTGSLRVEERPGRSSCGLCEHTGQGDEGLTHGWSIVNAVG
jgi:hypothetical protein